MVCADSAAAQCGPRNTCCFSGPRPQNYPWGEDRKREKAISQRLREEIVRALARGYRHFISGMAAGIDLIAAEIVVRLREEMSEASISLEAAVPFPSQPRRWRAETRRTYERLLGQCDRVHLTADAFCVAAYRERDRYMVDSSSLLIAVQGKSEGGTARTVAYAREAGREIVLIEP